MADGNRVDRTRVAGAPMAAHETTVQDQDSPAATTTELRTGDEPATDTARPRWTGSAAVPPRQPRRRWWHRRGRSVVGDSQPAGFGAAGPVDHTLQLPPSDDSGWEVTPAVDPWGDEVTPWLATPAFPEPAPQPVSQPAPQPVSQPAPQPLPPPQAPPWWPAPRSPAARAPQPVPAPPPVAAPPPAAAPSRRALRVDRRPAPDRSTGRGDGHPRGPLPQPTPRRRRRWPRTLLLFTLFSVACCCGAPAYLAWPAAQQYPVSAVLPAAVADLRLREDASSRRAADGLAERLRDTGPVGTDVFAGIYTDRNGKRVALFGTTGFRLTPKSDLEAEVQHLTGDYGLRDVQEFDLGQTGAHQRCGVGRADGKSVVVCGWADHGSLGAAVLTRRSVADSAELVALLRGSVLTRG